MCLDITGQKILDTRCGCGCTMRLARQPGHRHKSAMISRSLLQHYRRAMQHFASARATEVLALQASPLLGFVLGDIGGARPVDIGRFALLMAGSLALTAHIFVCNDWAGRNSDLR